MITANDAAWCLLAATALGAAAGAIRHHLGCGRIDWNAPAADAGEVDDYRGDIPPVVWSDAIPPGGYVCAVPIDGIAGGICGWPVDSEPCPAHGRLLPGGRR